jgi:hypothetical protein
MEIGFRMQSMKSQKKKAYLSYPQIKLAQDKRIFLFICLHEHILLLKVYI